MKLLLFISMVFLPVSSQAITWEEFWSPFYHEKDSYYNRHTNSVCYKNVYREQYIPGNKWSPGHVRSWVERVTVSCHY